MPVHGSASKSCQDAPGQAIVAVLGRILATRRGARKRYGTRTHAVGTTPRFISTKRYWRGSTIYPGQPLRSIRRLVHQRRDGNRVPNDVRRRHVIEGVLSRVPCRRSIFERILNELERRKPDVGERNVIG